MSPGHRAPRLRSSQDAAGGADATGPGIHRSAPGPPCEAPSVPEPQRLRLDARRLLPLRRPRPRGLKETDVRVRSRERGPGPARREAGGRLRHTQGPCRLAAAPALAPGQRGLRTGAGAQDPSERLPGGSAPADGPVPTGGPPSAAPPPPACAHHARAALQGSGSGSGSGDLPCGLSSSHRGSPPAGASAQPARAPSPHRRSGLPAPRPQAPSDGL